MKRRKKIAVLAPLPPNRSPGQRFRHELFLSFLERDYQVEYFPFWSQGAANNLYKSGKGLSKLMAFLAGFMRRIGLVFRLGKFDVVLIYRESTPVGPPFIEFIITKILRYPVIFDFDDAIWLKDHTNVNPLINVFRNSGKTKWICKWSAVVCCGNEYLANYAKRYNENVCIIPTVVDTDNQHNLLVDQSTRPIVVGWTGSHSTLKYLDVITPVIQELQKELKFEFRVIADRDPQLDLKHYSFRKWKRNSEILDLSMLQIGVMPLSKDEWSEGKCGFKAIQYLSLGIPTVLTDIGVNSRIVQDGESGFLCNDDIDWRESLRRLILSEDLRRKMGLAGREFIRKHYSVKVNIFKYSRMIKEVLEDAQVNKD